MSTKNASTPRQQESSQVTTSSDVSILPETAANVKNDIQALRLESKASVPDMVAAVQVIYPKYDRYLHSKVEHGEEYGIDLRSDAKRALVAAFAPENRKRRKIDRRTRPKRIQARVSDQTYAALQRIIGRSGITMQSFIDSLIIQYFRTHKED